MRKIQLTSNDFEMFDTDIGISEFEYLQQHKGAFKRMWEEQVSTIYSPYIDIIISGHIPVGTGCVQKRCKY